MARDPIAPKIRAAEEQRKKTQAKCMGRVLKRLADHNEVDALQWDTLLREFENLPESEKLEIPFVRVMELLIEARYVEFAPDARGEVSHSFVQISQQGMKAHQSGKLAGGSKARGSKKPQPAAE